MKAKASADKEHQDRLAAEQQEVEKLKGEVDRLRGVEREQHKTKQFLKGQIASVAMALKGMFAFFIRLLF